jgi:hypothetical protein
MNEIYELPNRMWRVRCYEREAMDLHMRETSLEYMRTLDINNY